MTYLDLINIPVMPFTQLTVTMPGNQGKGD